MVGGSLERPIAFDGQRFIPAREFLTQVHGLAAQLPECSHLLNLCDGRYAFMLTWCAALLRGIPTLLPPSRAPSVILEMLDRYPEAWAVGDDGYPDGVRLERFPPRFHSLPTPLPSAAGVRPQLSTDLLAAIGFTSGSSGPPKAQSKYWGSFCATTAHNLTALLAHTEPGCHLLATVPSQHMFGMETAVLLPLRCDVSIHTARPFFPADIVAALAQLPTPRVLVTTPVHLRALIESALPVPTLAVILCATAPLSQELAQAAEAATGAHVLEYFGSTETCIFGQRRTALETDWTRYAGVQIEPRPDGALVSADWLAEPVMLQDLIEVFPDGRFRLAGRASDLLEIAGKRVSLGELTRRLLALEGVRDAVVFQLDADGPVQRIAAMVVAPGCNETDLLAALRESIDPVFLPRPLRLVGRLPRNETGKLPRQALLEALRRSGESS
ncbi:MAG: AMP-binding protein [Pseudomarimonas sp.]